MAIGSSTVTMVFQLWAEVYKTKNPAVAWSARADGTVAAPKALVTGEAHIGLMTREMTPEELESFEKKFGYAPTRIATCMDAVVLLVNKNNPVKELRIDQLDALYTTSRKHGWSTDVATWGDLGVNKSVWASRPVLPLHRRAKSGTRKFFGEMVEAEGAPKPAIKNVNDILELTEALAANQGCIGYGSMSEVFSSLRAVPLIPLKGKTAIQPVVEEVATGNYPLSRFLYVYVNKAPGKPLDSAVEGMLQFILSPEGQALAKGNGHVPLPQDILELNLRRLKS